MTEISGVQAAVLGLVQGLTEFLPVSSSAQLRVLPAMLGWADPGAGFTAVVHLGTAAAAVLYLRRDLYRIAAAWTRSLVDPSRRGALDARLGWYLALGTVPIAGFGLAFANRVETGARNLWLVGAALVVFGLLLAAAERVAGRRRMLKQLTLRDGVVVGAAQALALVPGVGLLGATLTAGLFLGFTREAAARYALLLSVPAVLLSGGYQARHLGGPGGVPVGPALAAAAVAFLVGYAVIGRLLGFLTAHSTAGFVIYRVLLGAVVLGLLATGVLQPA